MSKDRAIPHQFEGEQLESVFVGRRDGAGAADRHPDPDRDGRLRPRDRLRPPAGRARLQCVRRGPVRQGIPRRPARHDVRRDEPAARPTARRFAGGSQHVLERRARARRGGERTRSSSPAIASAGMCALDLARSGADIAAAVSFHGLFDPPGLPPQKIKAKVVAFHGWDDPMVPPDKVVALGKELTEAGADWQIHAYGHVGHGFTNPQGERARDRRRRLQCARRRAVVDQLHQPARGIVRRGWLRPS